MRRLRGTLAMMWAAAAACGGGNSLNSNPPLRERPGEIIAFLDGQPITLDDVAAQAMEWNYRGLVDTYINFRLIQQRRQALNVTHDPQEIRARARMELDRRKQTDEEAFHRLLLATGKTESQWIDAYLEDAKFDAFLANEKMATYDLMRQGYTVVDLAYFKGAEDAESVERVEGLKINQVQAPWTLSKEFLEKVLEAVPGSVLDNPVAEGEGILRVWVKGRMNPLGGSFEELKQEVFAQVMADPPTSHQMDLWRQSLVKGAKVEYARRYTTRD